MYEEQDAQLFLNRNNRETDTQQETLSKSHHSRLDCLDCLIANKSLSIAIQE